MAFVHPFTVRFYEVDRAGIVFFGRVFEYSHAAFEEALAAGGLSSVFEARGWGMPLVHAEADFVHPMRLGERLETRVTVGRLGQTSVTFDFEIVGPDGDRRATVRQVHATIDLQTFHKREVPAELVSALEELGLLPG